MYMPFKHHASAPLVVHCGRPAPGWSQALRRLLTLTTAHSSHLRWSLPLLPAPSPPVSHLCLQEFWAGSAPLPAQVTEANAHQALDTADSVLHWSLFLDKQVQLEFTAPSTFHTKLFRPTIVQV
jgi:hypothetical protein